MDIGEWKKSFKVGVLSNVFYLALIVFLTDIESIEVILDSIGIYMNVYVACAVSLLLNGVITAVVYYIDEKLSDKNDADDGADKDVDDDEEENKDDGKSSGGRNWWWIIWPNE